MTCPSKWTNSIGEEDGQGSTWESEPEEEKPRRTCEFWRHLMMWENGIWPRRNRISRWRRRVDPRPAFHYLDEDDEGEQASGGLNHLVSRNAGGALWTWKRVTVVVDSGAADNVMAKEHVSRTTPQKATEGSILGEGVQRSRRRAHEELWTAGHVRQISSRVWTHGHVAGCRREKTLCVGIWTTSQPEATCSSGLLRHTSWMRRMRRNRCSEGKATCTCLTCW